MSAIKISIDEIIDRIEILRPMSNHLSLASLCKGMFFTQIHCKYIRVEDLVRMIMNVPLLREVSGRESKARVPRSLVNMLKGMLKLFAVDEKGRFKIKGEFRATGYRRMSYIYLSRLTGFSRSTVALNISLLKGAGLIDAFQEENLDGSKGAWWVRFNPFAYQIWVQKLKARSHGLSLDNTLAQAEKVATPRPADRTLLSSSKQEAASAVAVAEAAAGKKEIDSPAALILSLKEDKNRILAAQLAERSTIDSPEESSPASCQSVNSTAANPVSEVVSDHHSTPQAADFEQFARLEMLKSETGVVAKILEPAIPDIPDADATLLQQLHNLVHHPVPMYRLDRVMAELLVNTMSDDPEHLGPFANMGVLPSDGEESPKLTFLLKFWHGISKELWRTRLFQHDVNHDHDKAALHWLRSELFAPVDAWELSGTHKHNPGGYWIGCLALALTRKWATTVVTAIAQKARAHLMRAPVTYAIFRQRFPQIIRLCAIPEHCHKKLLEQAARTTADIAAWGEIKTAYGFEHTI